ncbi:MAG: metallophosphoesterase [Myxococcota bacterium]
MTDPRAAPPPPDFDRQIEALLGKATEPFSKGRIALRWFAGHVHHSERMSTPLRVAHLTDQHVGRVTPFRVQLEAVRLANLAQPDLVLLTGDFVCHSHQYLDQLEEVVASFDAPVFAVLGNHDHWSGADDVKWSLLRAGAELLENAHTVITVRHERIQLVGLDDAYTGHADVERATRGLDRSLPTVALSHIAEMAGPLWAKGVPLVLAGHTHGGQITVARLHEFTLGRVFGHRYVHGLYGCRRGHLEEGAVYVGAGIGAAVMPLRLGERGQREVTIFELGESPGGFEEHHVEQAALPGRPPSARQQAAREIAVERKRLRRERRARRAATNREEDDEG